MWYLDKPSVDVNQLNSAVSLDILRHQLVDSLIPGSQWTVGAAARKESLDRFSEIFPLNISWRSTHQKNKECLRLFAPDEGTDGPDPLGYGVRAVPVVLLADRQDDDLGRDVLQLSIMEAPQDVLCSVPGYSKVC